MSAAISSDNIHARQQQRVHDDEQDAVGDPFAHRIASDFAGRIGDRPYAMWFDRSARFCFDPKRRSLRVAVPNRFVADSVQRKFRPQLEASASAVVGEAVTVEVQVDAEGFGRCDSASRLPDAPARREAPARSVSAATSSSAAGANLRQPVTLRHRLDDFIVGPSNELAHAAASQLADAVLHGHDAPVSEGPLFIHGGCGLGKTHLLQGLCRRVVEQAAATGQTLRVLYLTGEQFTNEYITAVRSNTLDQFRRKMRALDLLAVDDVHFIANKTATQQEFLHSFDHIELGGARVVLASDSHPKAINQFSDALVSRCVRGLVVQVNPPDAPTRRKLVQSLADRRGLMVQPSAAEAMAEQARGSVREIEGLLTKLHALATLTGDGRPGQAIGHNLVDRLLVGEGQPARPHRLQFEHVSKAVCEELGVTAGQLASRGRQKHVVLARALIVHLARQLTAMSFPEIAAAMGKPNHSTVITAAQRLQKQLDQRETVVLPCSMTQIALTDLVERLRRSIQRG